MSSKAITDNMLAWLKERATAIKELESTAYTALHTHNDPQKYKELLIKKALLLSSIREDADPLLAELSEPQKRMLSVQLGRFSQSAEIALDLDSSFYMSALLYPDEHLAGQPNNLELLIADFSTISL